MTANVGGPPRPDGVIEATRKRIEHPELIAERNRRYADIVGSDLAAADIAWHKRAAMAQGAGFVSQELW